ncbi:MAG: DMT family transporter [Proteobacteria bacterium]|jgi:drug/metabolite transporter (DMT)-like permease|nr:DMT family transporter [Pseudomonadota bacterium]
MSVNLKSIMLMIIAMGCLTLTDMLIKIASHTLPIGQVMITYGMGALVVFWGLLRINGEAIQLSPLTNPAVIWRNIGDLIAMNSMFLALVYVPLSTIGAVIQAVPLLVTAAAALFLGEQVGLRRVSAIFAGFLGTLLIIQPGANTFDITTTLVLVAALGMALRDIATKLVCESFSTLLLSFYSCFLFIFSGIILLMINGVPNVPEWGNVAILAAMIVAGCLGFFFMTEAVRLGDVSVVIPFRYSRLLFSMAAGILILGEQVNAMMLIGSALTILSGLYIWRREIVPQSPK